MQNLAIKNQTVDALAMGASVRRWKGFWLSLCLSVCGLCLAVGTAWADTGKEPTVRQAFWLDGTQQMSFEEARAAAFSPLYPGMRQKFSKGVGWARLTLEGSATAGAPVMLQIRPALFSRVTVFTPPEKDGGPWLSRDITAEQLSQPFALGVSKPGDTVYLRLQAPWDQRVILGLGSAHALNAQQRQIDVVATFNMTLLLTFFFVTKMQRDSGFRRLRYAIYLFSVCSWTGLLFFMGYGQTLAGLDPLQCNWLIRLLYVFSLFAIGLVWTFFASALFPKSRGVRWLFLWPGAMLLMIVMVWGDIDLTLQISEHLQTPGAFLYMLFLLVSAIRQPDALSAKSAKVALFILLMLSAVVALKSSTAYFGWGILPNYTINLNVAVELMVRGLIPLVITVLIYLLLASARQQRLSHLQSSLDNTQGSLDLEKQRLERQLKFTVMLSHELKNPLMASQMALSNLQRHLAPVGPSRQSADTIQQSLETIDTIIERCAEVDAYECANVPLTMSQFSVADLLAALKAVHKNERIYIVTRRVDDALLLTSDLHYLKVIISNLLINALKYSQPDTLVELQLIIQQAEHGPQLAFSVSNTLGVAGSPDPAQVFGRYYRSEGARQQPGTGQGLWLAQSMAKALGSLIKLKVDGTAVTFGFSLSAH